MKHTASVQALVGEDGHAAVNTQACTVSDRHTDPMPSDAVYAIHLANAAASPAEPVPQYNTTRALSIGLAVSLAVHGLIAALFWLMPAWLQAKAPPDTQALQMELFGMLSNRQEQEQQQGLPDTPPPQPQAAPEPPPAEPSPGLEPEPEPEPPPDPVPEPIPEPPPELPPPAIEPPEPSPVQVKPPAKPKPKPKPAPAARPSAPQPPPAPKGAEVARVQQTIASPDMQTLMQAYVRELSRMLQRSLVYPREARREGYVGSTTVRFSITEDGTILPGSLSIQRSSGYAILDEQALKTARSNAPFPAPPKSMTVSITIAFRER